MKEFVRGIEQRSNYATLKDVQIKLRKEESALGMGQRRDYYVPSSEGKKQAYRGEVCWRHGANCNTHDESTHLDQNNSNPT